MFLNGTTYNVHSEYIEYIERETYCKLYDLILG